MAVLTPHARLAVSVEAMHRVPAPAWLLVPFTALIVAPRVVLGLHSPRDVAAGALIGLLRAAASLALGAVCDPALG